MKLIGKFPFIEASPSKLDFEKVLVGDSLTKSLTLTNKSLVKSEFKIINEDEKLIINFFSFDKMSGTLEPDESTNINIKYSPQIVNLASYVHCKLIVSGGDEFPFVLSGSCLGFDVQLSNNSVHFSEVFLGNSTNRVVNLQNKMNTSTTFQIYSDQQNIFSFSHVRGILKPNSSQRIVIKFTPNDAMNYYERAFILIRNHLLLYVDLIGTCTDLLRRPYPLYQKHVDVFRHRVIMNTINDNMNPETFLELMESLVKTKKEKIANTIDNGKSFSTGNSDLLISQISLHKEMFMNSTNSSIGVGIKVNLIRKNI